MSESDAMIAGVFKSRADARGMSMSDVAREIGISRELVRRSFAGTRPIKPSEFVRMCRSLGVGLDDFSEVV